MTTRAQWLRWSATVALFAVLAGPSLPVGAGDQAGDAETQLSTLTIARVSGNPRKHIKALGALGGYLAPRLADLGVGGYDVRLARDNSQMIGWLLSGAVDLVMETPFSALTYEREAGAELLLRAWKDGEPSYRTLFFTRKDSGISTLDDLAGRVIAFEDPGSTSGFFVPLMTLRRHGLTLEPDSPDQVAVPKSAVRYVFAGSEVNVAAWVARGKVAAGTLSDLDWNNPAKTPPGIKQDLAVVHETPDIVRSLIVVRKDLPAVAKQRINDVLLVMHEKSAGRSALAALYETARFDAIEGPVAQSLDHVRGLVEAFAAPPGG